MDESLLDTDMLNELLKQKNANVVKHGAAYLTQHGRFAISAISRYEVLRGLLERNATSQLSRFRVFCNHSRVLPVTDHVLEQAAFLWAVGRRRGFAPNDADLLIAASAMSEGLTLVTGNTSHFSWIPGLRVANWRLP